MFNLREQVVQIAAVPQFVLLEGRPVGRPRLPGPWVPVPGGMVPPNPTLGGSGPCAEGRGLSDQALPDQSSPAALMAWSAKGSSTSTS